jgi:hypothetical protein
MEQGEQKMKRRERILKGCIDVINPKKGGKDYFHGF